MTLRDAVAAAPDFVGGIIKATQGTNYAPQWFDTNWAKLKDAGGDRYCQDWFRGAYHFLNLQEDGTAQADYYLTKIDKAGGFGPILDQPSQFVEGGKKAGQFWTTFWPSLTAMIGFWATLALNIPDFTRFAKSQRDQVLGQSVGLPVPMGLLAMLGMGALFAYFGQTYQTGADPWQLFALWAALSLPLRPGDNVLVLDGSAPLDELALQAAAWARGAGMCLTIASKRGFIESDSSSSSDFAYPFFAEQ